MMIIYRVHWFTVTIWTSYPDILKIWNERFGPIFGTLINLKHGGRGFRSIHKSISGIQIYSDPVNIQQDQETYISMSIPGDACDALTMCFLHDFLKYLNENYRINITRLDIAFDHAPFSPKEFFQELLADKVRTYAKRHTFNFQTSPFNPQDEGGEIGCDTAQVGAGQSNRKLRVYNRRGYTRVELEVKKKRADGIAKDVMLKDPSYWSELFMGHMRDFIDLVEDKDTGLLVDFWAKFVLSIPRAGLTVTDPREIEKYRLMGWLHEQISPAFSVFLDLYGEDGLREFYKYGRKKRGERYDLLLQDHDDIFNGGEDDEE